MSRTRVRAALLGGALLLAACNSGGDDAANEPAGDSETAVGRDAAQSIPYRYPDPPEAPDDADPVPPQAREALDRLTTSLESGTLDAGAVTLLADNGDVRQAWYVADLMRFFGQGEGNILVDAFEQMTGATVGDDPASEQSTWLSVTNHLIAWDTPDYPDYRVDKGNLFTRVEPAWQPFFDDENATIDWRHLSWGGVLIDSRELGDPNGCPNGCIPSLDDPAVTDAAGGDWYPDDAIVFGVTAGDEALAIPKNIAEVHEMFNLTLGGRRLGIPYCTLCGSAQAYLTDNTGADEQPVLRTTGLLNRSNKVMYDLATSSVFDTFTGVAVSGPLFEAGLELEQTTTVVSTWGKWKAEHPDTFIIAEDGGVGRTYPEDPLGGRDDNGPVFPIGQADDRLGEQDLVVGVVATDGTPVAFPSDQATEVLDDGGEVSATGVELLADGDGLRAVDSETGAELVSHESFWFAWSQFNPTTELWTG